MNIKLYQKFLKILEVAISKFKDEPLKNDINKNIFILLKKENF